MSPQPWPFWWRKPHGTPAAYQRHRRLGEDACPPCKQAEALRSAIRQERRAAVPAHPYAAAVHYRWAPDPAVYGQPRGYPACGRPADVTLTSDPAQVTCRQCKRNGIYRQAVA